MWYRLSWNIGILADLGSTNAVIWSDTNTLEKTCPNNEGYFWNWNYWEGSSYINTNYVYIKCAYEDDFCTKDNPCGENQGDCDTHDECQDGLACGSNNCLDSLGFHSEFDCCYQPIVGDKDFCTTDNPCAVDEGDCDSDNECQTPLFCDIANSCPSDNDINCCVSTCESHFAISNLS